MSIISFGAKWYPDEVFEDKQARSLDEIYPGYNTAKTQVS
jgi:hypothetical protein